MDEPLRDLAPLDATRVLEAVRLLAAAGTAVLLTGHQVAELLDAADRVAWCTDGTTVEFASADEARADDRFRQHYLGLA